MAVLNIVLMNPQIAPNTGNVVRTCAVTGARLHIIKPMGFEPTNKHLKRAGLDYWGLLDLTFYESREEFFEKTQGGEYYYFSSKAPRSYADITYPDNCYIIFGSEETGLPEDLIHDNPQRTVRIPMIDDKRARCLNLATSAAVAAYEVLRQWGFPALKNNGHLDQFDWDNFQPEMN